MKPLFAASIIFVAGTLAACANPAERGEAQIGEQSLRFGVITQIDAVELDGHHQPGVGTVAGAAVGGIIGHQIGGGGGRDVATVLGVIGGGIAGNEIESHNDRRPGQKIFVRLDNGTQIAVTQPTDNALRVGDRVSVQGAGTDARVVRG